MNTSRIVRTNTSLEAAITKIKNRRRGKAAVLAGQHGEMLARQALAQLGVHQIEKIEVGWRLQRVGGKIIGASPMAKVAGDYRGILAGGRSVMVEAKERKSGSLIYSDLEPHQHQHLMDHAKHGGLSLVIAIFPRKCVAVFEYPLDALQPRKPAITPDTVLQIAKLVIDLGGLP